VASPSVLHQLLSHKSKSNIVPQPYRQEEEEENNDDVQIVAEKCNKKEEETDPLMLDRRH
jgi:hypothetical protein